MTNEEVRRAYQSEKAQEFEQQLAAAKEAQQAYLDSEQYKKDVWEAGEKRFAAKAKREGWTYTKRPYPNEAKVQAEAQQARMAEIEKLETRLKELKGEL